VRIGAVSLALSLAALAVPAPAGAAPNPCRGLQVCIPVAGPWVVVPQPTPGGASSTQYLMRCPKRSVVGGTDAEVTDRALDVAFLGAVGAPVAPGVTTHDTALFLGTYTGAAARPSSFRPLLGCVPTSGGGGTGNTSYEALPPGQPLDRQTTSVRVRDGVPARATLACPAGERLIGSSVALSFPQRRQPPIEQLADVHASRRMVDGRVVATATRGSAVPAAIRVNLQVQALCGKRP
jgi:hypothetical protein